MVCPQGFNRKQRASKIVSQKKKQEKRQLRSYFIVTYFRQTSQHGEIKVPRK